MRGKREKVLNRRQLGQNGLGWVLYSMLFASIKKTHNANEPFLDTRGLVDIPQDVGRGIKVDDMIFSSLISLFVSKVIPFQVKGSDISWQPMKVRFIEVTGHPPNNEAQIFERDFFEDDFEQVSIVSEKRSTTTELNLS